MTYFVPSKIVRDVIGKAIVANTKQNDGFDAYLQKMLIEIMQHEKSIDDTVDKKKKNQREWVNMR